MIVFFVLMFLGGIFSPVDIMPKGISYISGVLPSTHLNDTLRIIAVENGSLGDIWLNVVAAVGLMVACLALSVRFFKWE